MQKITHLTGITWYSCNNKVIPKVLLGENLTYLVQCNLNKTEETGQMQDKKRSVRPKRLSTVQEQCLKSQPWS